MTSKVLTLARSQRVFAFGALCLMGTLTGCSDPKAPTDANFARAINLQLKETNPAVVPVSVNFPYTYAEGSAWGVRREELDALVTAGLLATRPTTTERYVGYGQPKAQQPATEYFLTEEGKKYYTANTPGNFFRVSGFLCGEAEVAKIENFAEINMLGMKGEQIKYTYHIVNLAKWTENNQVRTAFPTLAKVIEAKDTPVEQTTVLQLTNSGWTHKL